MIIKQITSLQNSYLKMVKQLSQRKMREAKDLFLLEGLRGLQEAIESDFTIESLIISSAQRELCEGVLLKAVLERVKAVYEVPACVFTELTHTENPQGILLVIQQKKYSFDQILRTSHSLVVIADSLQDPGNLGTIIRTAAAAGTDCLLLTKGCVDLYNPKVIRATMGGIFRIPVASVDNNVELIKALKAKAFQTFVAHLGAKKNHFEVDFTCPVALIIGNENRGPSPEFIENADYKVKIPMVGNIESLNASVATGILLYEIVRQRSTGASFLAK